MPLVGIIGTANGAAPVPFLSGSVLVGASGVGCSGAKGLPEPYKAIMIRTAQLRKARRRSATT